jgi:ferric-dicitrate binding protein FerR (iron transport regulator)
MTASPETALLFQRYMGQTATDAEKTELLERLSAADREGTLDQLLQSLWEGLEVKEPVFTNLEKDQIVHRILHKGKAVVRPMVLRTLASVAAVFILFIAGYFLVFHRKDDTIKQTAGANPARDIDAPKLSKAVITLADGKQVSLDNVVNGIVAQEANVRVVKNEKEEIVYQGMNAATATLSYNTLLNPRGSKVIALTLSDGTKVWLNSESSLKYPTLFVGTTREVEVSGEAYFEVAHSDTKPFIVSKGATKVQVLGTHFNINAFEDEEALRVTLLEGKVKVSDHNSSVTIQPQQQAVVKAHLPPIINPSPDVSEVMAWKNGVFRFKDVTIQELMRQIARWYDVQVIYEGQPASHFVATIPRDVSAANLFRILEQTGGVHFTIDGNKVIVKP